MALPTRKVPVVPTSRAIGFLPALAGTLPLVGNGATWATAIRTRGLSSVEWRVLDARDAPRSDWHTLTGPALTSAAGAAVAVPFLATGDLVMVRAPGDDTVYARSSRVRLIRPDPLEPAAPVGWVVAFHDDFNATRLDRGVWRLIAAGAGQDPALVTARSGGLVLQAARGANGVYRTSGIQISSSAAGGPSWGDMQVSVKLRAEPGRGLGLLASLVPFQAGAALPRIEVQTPDAERQLLRATDYWTGNAAGNAANYWVDLTGWHVVTLRRTAGRWNLWIDQIEQAVPPAWASNAYRDALTLALATQVLPAVDGAPDAGSPALWSAFVDFVKVSAPA